MIFESGFRSRYRACRDAEPRSSRDRYGSRWIFPLGQRLGRAMILLQGCTPTPIPLGIAGTDKSNVCLPVTLH